MTILNNEQNHEIRDELEKKHNVFIDFSSETFTAGDQDDLYGWQPLPAKWVKCFEKGGQA